MKFCLPIIFSALLLVVGCAGTTKNQNAWDDIDYSKVRDRAARDNDSNYKAPSVVGCVSDDLYDCR